MNKKYRFEQFLLTDFEAIEEHLSAMAARGWQLEKISPFCWTYRRVEPSRRTYTVTYFSEASEFNPGPTNNQQTFHEYCEAAGWRFVAELAQMQIFCADREDPVPIETDEGVRLRSIHRSMKKNFLPSTLVLLLLGLLQLFIQWSSFRSGTVEFLSQGTGVYAALLWLILCLYAVYILADYFLWYRRSRMTVEAGGACGRKNVKSRQVINRLVMLLSLLILILSIFSMLGTQLWWAGLLGMGIASITILVVLGVKSLLKKAKASRKVNFAVTLAASFAVTFALMSLMVWSLLSTNFGRRQPAYFYTTYTSSGAPLQWDIYRDPIPLTLEELGLGLGYPHYSYELSEDNSPFLRRLGVRQGAAPDGQEVPELQYEMLTLRFPWLYQICLDDYLWHDSRWDQRRFIPVEEPAWGARQVYHQMRDDSTFTGTYLACYEDKILRLTIYGDELTGEQIKTAVQKLLGQEGG